MIKKVKFAVKDIFGSAFGPLCQPMLKNTLLVLTYHDVSDNPGEFSRRYFLNVSTEVFEYQMGFFKKNFNVIDIDALLNNDIPPRAALITFDDGFESYFRNAVPVLNKLDIPSVLFLNMGPVRGELFWAGIITWLCDRADFVKFLSLKNGRLSKDRPVYMSCGRNIVEEYLSMTKISLDEIIPDYVGGFATEEDLRINSSNPLLYYGNHLYNHDAASSLSDEELYDSYKKNADCLKNYPNYRDVLALPFGHPPSCYTDRQVKFIIGKGVKRVFRNSGAVNNNIRQAFLDRKPMYQFDNTIGRIWSRVYKN